MSSTYKSVGKLFLSEGEVARALRPYLYAARKLREGQEFIVEFHKDGVVVELIVPVQDKSDANRGASAPGQDLGPAPEASK